MKAWLKQGLIGLGVGIVALLLQSIAFATGEILKGSLEWITWILLLPTLPAMYIAMIIGMIVGLIIGNAEAMQAFFFFGKYLTPIIYFIIGALIGLLTQKPKKKL